MRALVYLLLFFLEVNLLRRDIKFPFINGNTKFMDNFVCGIGNIFVKFHQETLFIIQNIEVQCRKRFL